MIKVQKEWAVHYPISFSSVPKTWKEMAERMGEKKEWMRAEKERVEKESNEAREETKRETEALRAMLAEATKKAGRE